MRSSPRSVHPTIQPPRSFASELALRPKRLVTRPADRRPADRRDGRPACAAGGRGATPANSPALPRSLRRASPHRRRGRCQARASRWRRPQLRSFARQGGPLSKAPRGRSRNRLDTKPCSKRSDIRRARNRSAGRLAWSADGSIGAERTPQHQEGHPPEKGTPAVRRARKATELPSDEVGRATEVSVGAVPSPNRHLGGVSTCNATRC